MYCPKCGETNPEGVRHCFVCGASMRGATSQPPVKPKAAVPFAEPAVMADPPRDISNLDSVQPAPVPTRREWNSRIYKWTFCDHLFAILWIVGAPGAAFLLGYTIYVVHEYSGWNAAELWSSFLGFVVLACLLHLFTRLQILKRRSRYQLHCAKVCLEHEDLIGGIDYAFGVKGWVDETEIASLLIALAKLAKSRDHPDWAQTLLVRARDRWNSPHARAALGELS